ncbi:calcium/manganese antiporter SLC30A10 isoform X3 [Hyperolius riggenbachi]|uniref:calcium/manganese antiporter SLC30A10 isoform X3 n=1 Tax=Hyperolius riggenbachi TaxID=752182 RepID=UPI0035A2F9D8
MGRYTGKTCRLIFMLVITVIFFFAELVSGYLGNSIALISDSFNMLSDLISLCVGITASRISRRTKWGPRVSYGYARAEVVGALCNAVFLTALCFTILVDSVLRLAKPQRIDGVELVLIVGALGLGVNIIGLLVFQDYGSCIRSIRRHTNAQDPENRRKPSNDQLNVTPYKANDQGPESNDHSGAGDPLDVEDVDPEEEMNKNSNKAAALNIRGVLLHVMGDALGSVVVVVAALIFYLIPLDPAAPCNWQCYIDPSLTLVMVAIILFSAFPLIRETATILLQMVPKDVNVGEIALEDIEIPQRVLNPQGDISQGNLTEGIGLMLPVDPDPLEDIVAEADPPEEGTHHQDLPKNNAGPVVIKGKLVCTRCFSEIKYHLKKSELQTTHPAS